MFLIIYGRLIQGKQICSRNMTKTVNYIVDSERQQFIVWDATNKEKKRDRNEEKFEFKHIMPAVSSEMEGRVPLG